ncbi:unnamed protein product [Caenorhabditis bovis]|uniref:Ubiquitin carboxyl-terminal hydrolase n=1 Tax=Caenorhabditis bovis TaxID=2654633 RepID=A0A8S1E9K6_9PELO|nr:unnamed protein product [Caenorhabditis bovis]
MASWTPLESDPLVFNDMMAKIGVTGAKCVDVLYFDDESIEKPQLAVVLCFPQYEKVWEITKPNYEAAAPADSVFFMRQNIRNACGTFALFHSLANLEDRINIGNGPFAQWLSKAKAVGSAERSDILEKDAELAKIHEQVAARGATAAPATVKHHFIAFVNKNGKLLEIDSRFDFAREIGPTSDETLVKDVGAAVKHLFDKLNDIQFSALALVKN